MPTDDKNMHLERGKQRKVPESIHFPCGFGNCVAAFLGLAQECTGCPANQDEGEGRGDHQEDLG